MDEKRKKELISFLGDNSEIMIAFLNAPLPSEELEFLQHILPIIIHGYNDATEITQRKIMMVGIAHGMPEGGPTAEMFENAVDQNANSQKLKTLAKQIRDFGQKP